MANTNQVIYSCNRRLKYQLSVEIKEDDGLKFN